MPIDDLTALGDALRAARKEKNLTQEQLADESHVSTKQIADIEKAKRNPSYLILKALAKVVHLSLDSLMYSDPAFYTDAKYWNREYRNAMVSMHIGRPIMGQRVVDILTLLDFCSEHEFLKGHPVKVFANGIYGPVAIHAAYLDERINSVEIKHSVKTWKEYIERPMQWDMYSNVLYGALKYYDLPDLIRLSNCPICFAD